MKERDPMDGLERLPRRQCTATSKQSGERCKRAPAPGQWVCVMHGAASAQARAAARLRLSAAADAAVARLLDELDAAEHSRDRLRAAEAILDRAGLVRGLSSADELAEVRMLFDQGLDGWPGAPRSAELE